MMNLNKILVPFIVLICCFAFQSSNLYSQNKYINTWLYPSKIESMLYEVHDIRFVGNVEIQEDVLLSVINTKPSGLGLVLSPFKYMYENISANESAPDRLTDYMKNVLKSYESGIVYFDELLADNDLLSLQNFYNINGFHDIKVSYTFLPDTINFINVLTFHIKENKRYKLGYVNFLGLESVPDYLMNKINEFTKVRSYHFFSESDLIRRINETKKILLDNGYYYTRYDSPPTVFKDTTKIKDSVVVQFHPGKRQRIAHIKLIDSTFGQPVVSKNTKLSELRFKEGDWYSSTKIAESKENLTYLGLFNLVAIDTSSSFNPITDSTLSMAVKLHYRKQLEYSVGLYVNRTLVDNTDNLGIEGSVIFRNLFNGAQEWNPYLRLILKDPSNVTDFQFEAQAGWKWGQNSIFDIGTSKIGFYWTPQYSYRRLKLGSEDFYLQTISIPVKFPWRFASHVFFNIINFDIGIEQQKPIGFDSAYSKSSNLDDLTELEREKRLESVYLYKNLNQYYKNDEFRLSAVIFGINAISDKRNDMFSPNRGHFLTFNLDYANPDFGGVANFVRTQAAIQVYGKLGKGNDYAGKLRIGNIWSWQTPKFDSAEYVPVERQFFAGGSNSNRGWPSRMLRYTRDTTSRLGATEFLQKFIGNSSIIEISLEARLRLPTPKRVSDFWREQISNIGVTLFMDISNAYDWFYEKNRDTKFEEYFTKLAVGMGAGIRYNTPIGPIRLDFGYPVYAPPGVWVDRSLQVHFGIGHAF